MRLTEKIIATLQNTFDTLIFFATMAVKEDFRNYVAHAGVEQMSSERRLAILGNGPSLKQQLPQLIEQQAWQKMDMMAVNFFALSEEYKVVCPKFYILSDPQFFRKAGILTDSAQVQLHIRKIPPVYGFKFGHGLTSFIHWTQEMG